MVAELTFTTGCSSSGNFIIHTIDSTTYTGLQVGTFVSPFSATFSAAMVGSPTGPSIGTVDHINEARSGFDGIYKMLNAIVPAYWGFMWESSPCLHQSVTSSEPISKDDLWEVTCYHTVYVVGLTTFDEDGNAIEAGCCETDTMTNGMSLNPGDLLRSEDGRFTLEYQFDGDLVLYDEGGIALWRSNTSGTSAGHVDMQGDGNFVIYDGSFTPVWWSGTANSPDAHLLVQNDGNVVLYDTLDIPIWATNTCCH